MLLKRNKEERCLMGVFLRKLRGEKAAGWNKLYKEKGCMYGFILYRFLIIL